MPRISALQSNTRAAAKDELPSVDVDESTTKKITVDMIQPTGAILDYAGQSAPAGWLMCYGQTLNAQTSPQYQDLYLIIGNTFGGSSNADFKLPDLRGRVVAGQDDMGGVSADRLTGATGSVNGDTMGATGGGETHRHKGYDEGDGAGNGDLRAAIGAVASDANRIGYAAIGATMPNNTVPRPVSTYSVVGSAQAANRTDWNHFTPVYGYVSANSSVQPTIILNKIIKY